MTGMGSPRSSNPHSGLRKRLGSSRRSATPPACPGIVPGRRGQGGHRRPRHDQLCRAPRWRQRAPHRQPLAARGRTRVPRGEASGRRSSGRSRRGRTLWANRWSWSSSRWHGDTRRRSTKPTGCGSGVATGRSGFTTPSSSMTRSPCCSSDAGRVAPWHDARKSSRTSWWPACCGGCGGSRHPGIAPGRCRPGVRRLGGRVRCEVATGTALLDPGLVRDGTALFRALPATADRSVLLLTASMPTTSWRPSGSPGWPSTPSPTSGIPSTTLSNTSSTARSDSAPILAALPTVWLTSSGSIRSGRCSGSSPGACSSHRTGPSCQRWHGASIRRRRLRSAALLIWHRFRPGPEL